VPGDRHVGEMILSYSRMWKALVPWRLVLVVLFLAVTNIHANVRYRIGLLYHNFDGMDGVLVFAMLWLLSVFGILAISRIRSRLYKGVFLLVFFGFTFFGVAFEYSIGTQLKYDNFAIAWEGRAHGADAIGFYWGSIVVAFLVSAVGCAAISTSRAAHRPAGSDPVTPERGVLGFPGVAGFVASLPFFAVCALLFVRGGSGSDGLPIQYKAPALFAMVLVNEAFAEIPERRKVEVGPVEKGIRNIVLIVDESVRGDYASSSELLPSLGRMSRYRHDFGIAVSATNCSAGSNMTLRMGAAQKGFQDTINLNPYIWDYARRAGYRSVFVEAQYIRGRLNNRISLDEKARIDEFIWADGRDRFSRDLAAARLVRSWIRREGKHFVYVVKSGIHFPYEGSYDVESAHYHPHMDGMVVPDRERMRNSYKNAIRYAIDGFFRELAEGGLDLSDSIIIYTSDHGQNLLDNGSQLTHCSVDNSTTSEVLVPLMVFSGQPQIVEKLRKYAVINRDKLSHFNIVPTILEVMGFPPTDGSSTIFDRVDDARGFYTGVVRIGNRSGPGKFNQLRFVPVSAAEVGRHRNDVR